MYFGGDLDIFLVRQRFLSEMSFITWLLNVPGATRNVSIVVNALKLCGPK